MCLGMNIHLPAVLGKGEQNATSHRMSGLAVVADHLRQTASRKPSDEDVIQCYTYDLMYLYLCLEQNH